MKVPGDPVLRFRSGPRYRFVAVSPCNGIWRTTSRQDRTNDIEPISQVDYNRIGKIERWDDLIARANDLALATQWKIAPARVRATYAVVRFILETTGQWEAAIHVGDDNWYSTAEVTRDGSARQPGFYVYDDPVIGSWRDITSNAAQIELATAWQPLTGVGLPFSSD